MVLFLVTMYRWVRGGNCVVDLVVEVVKLRRLSGNCRQVKLKFGVSNPTPWSEKVELVVSWLW